MIGFRRTLHLSLTASALAVAAACSDSTGPRRPLPPKGIAVLNGYGQTGITLADTTAGSPTTLIPFTNGTFDGGSFAVERDSALTTSSSLAGDLLWVVDLKSAQVRRIQMPPGSDPSNAAFLHGVDAVSFGVTLRGTAGLALVSDPAATPPTVRVIPAGRCPTDVFEHGGSFYVVDANADCANFAADGVARLIRFTPDGAAHDTIGMAAGAIGTSASAVVSGDFAYVASPGDAVFGGPEATFTRPGVVTKVNLATGLTAGSLGLPAGTYGATLHLGEDGRLYVVAYTSTDFSTRGVYAIDPATMSFTGPRATGGGPALDLRVSSDVGFSCGAATADALGRIYCVAVDYVSAGASTVYVFDRNGNYLRAFPAGDYAVDIALR